MLDAYQVINPERLITFFMKKNFETNSNKSWLSQCLQNPKNFKKPRKKQKTRMPKKRLSRLWFL